MLSFVLYPKWIKRDFSFFAIILYTPFSEYVHSNAP